MKPVKVFYCYAREDETLRQQLAVHLALQKRQGIIEDWCDRMISPGQPWEEEIDHRLEEAQLVLLLVSAYFLASDYCYQKEMKRALERHKAGEAQVIPIILRPVYWEPAPFSELQCLPKDGHPVEVWPNMHEAFTDIAKGIRLAAEAEIRRQLEKEEAQRRAVEAEAHRKAEEAEARRRAEKAEAQRQADKEKEKRRTALKDTAGMSAVQYIHGWSAQQVQELQRQTALALGLTVEFRDTLKDGSQGPLMVVIPGGRFLMGSPADEPGRSNDERQHEVEVAPFAIGKYTVTFEEYDRLALPSDKTLPIM